jgi:hypothetical protein
MPRTPTHDPRTVAREIPGIFDSIFPQLTPGIVAHLNRDSLSIQGVQAVPSELIAESTLQHAMLFEIGFAAGEQLVSKNVINWETSLERAVSRQRRHFDAKIPNDVTASDRNLAELIANNIAHMLRDIRGSATNEIVISPRIPGFQWIASGNGDFSFGSDLVEVKCSSRNFSSSDYRQIIFYWLLSYASSVENDSLEWESGFLLNPRSVKVVKVNFDELIKITGAGRSKVEVLEVFSAMVGSRDVI